MASSLDVALETVRRRDRVFLQQQVRYDGVQVLPQIWPLAAQRFGDTVAMRDPHGQPPATLTYRQLCDRILTFASGLQALGVSQGTHVALFADNSHRWFIADQGIMTAGGVNAVRSAMADTEELLYIAEHSDSTVLVVQDLALWQRLRPHLDPLPIRQGILLSDQPPPQEESLKLLSFQQLLALGNDHSLQAVTTQPADLATLIYTSGTTGKPKGVMLTHGNLLHQINHFGAAVQPQVGDGVLGILPSWHSFERTVEYYLYSQGCSQTYTTIRHVKTDLRQAQPQYMVGVPRLWESIYEGAQKQFREQPPGKQRLINTFFGLSHRYVNQHWRYQDLQLDEPHLSPGQRLWAGVMAAVLWPLHQLGKRLVYGKVRAATGGRVKQLISGGGSLARHIDVFFEIVDVPLLVGYGLTETSPVLSVRRPWRNLRGASGQPIPQTELRVVDPDSRQDLPQGQKGLVLARGPQIMAGYYKNPEATAKVLDPEGWFDTGDLGWLTHDYNLVLTGRAKDTIVLTNGENIEPQPIEDACVRSPYIDQIMLVGQDQRSLGALIVPNLEALDQWAASQGRYLQVAGKDDEVPPEMPPISLEDEAVQALFRRELTRQVKDRPGYRPDDRIGPPSS
ncbi:long-chain fatty acid--CoA ligase [Halomicronema hongdechloris C2206]|uniref:Long-chain fatty acid--CoA ligase n=1 Tax=Halomicronema hongdechloris C2206 TaxID=1641165 RepID=A0A1Z3HH46_9CYAN|nr:AMP-binding protein [Halomicronema hongdechloris]ASC69616.1 long-chain fatty acid--CoA ligase [Halomicronema hongdechloris C2206]